MSDLVPCGVTVSSWTCKQDNEGVLLECELRHSSNYQWPRGCSGIVRAFMLNGLECACLYKPYGHNVHCDYRTFLHLEPFLPQPIRWQCCKCWTKTAALFCSAWCLGRESSTTQLVLLFCGQSRSVSSASCCSMLHYCQTVT